MAKGTKSISTSFKVILLLVTLIFGAYLIRLFTGTKQTILPEDTIVAKPLVKHKKKHKLKHHASPISSFKPIVDTGALVSVPPVKTEQLKPVIVQKALPVKQVADSDKFLYVTYVRANVTGIVKLRAQNNFYSNTIADIPGNTKVWVIEKGNIYYKVAYNNTIGFVPKWTLLAK